MEAWSATEGGAPYVYDFSFGYDDIDFYALGSTHAAGEQFVLKVFKGDLAALGGPDGDHWAGSKVRKLMNRPAFPSAAEASPADATAAASAVATVTAGDTAVLPPLARFDAPHGVHWQPALGHAPRGRTPLAGPERQPLPPPWAGGEELRRVAQGANPRGRPVPGAPT
jgi:hypothetical protein